jgi:small redox-active disulfide protein 2
LAEARVKAGKAGGRQGIYLLKGNTMKAVKILGTGCANCKNTLALVETVAAERNVAIALEKVEDLPAIMSYGVMSTPAVVIDGVVVHAGGVPARSKVESWF